jgi:hypothetical protein
MTCGGPVSPLCPSTCDARGPSQSPPAGRLDEATPSRAVAATFANRETAIDVAPIAFTPDFTEQASTLTQWSAFRSRLPNAQCPEKLSDVVTSLTEFLLPIARACAAGERFERRWTPGGPWATSS